MVKARIASSNLADLNTVFVLPVISSSDESLRQVTPQRIEIEKPEGVLVVEANVPLSIENNRNAVVKPNRLNKSRVFNLVPGFQAVPIIAKFTTAGFTPGKSV